MSHCLIDCVLTHILTGETETICGSDLEGETKVNEVEVLLSPLLIVLDELVVEVTFGKVVGTVLVELYEIMNINR